eukprot:4442739-Pyramimonas_sp.AAC.1
MGGPGQGRSSPPRARPWATVHQPDARASSPGTGVVGCRRGRARFLGSSGQIRARCSPTKPRRPVGFGVRLRPLRRLRRWTGASLMD